MLGHKAREFKQHKSISLEDLVPDDNFYRQVERSIDLSFVREVVDKFYASMERPSIDPVVFFKLQWIDFFEGIRSERQLVVTVKLNLAYRRFLGDHLNEPVPDHISLSRIRGHFGLIIIWKVNIHFCVPGSDCRRIESFNDQPHRHHHFLQR